METEEPMEVEVLADLDKFDELLEEGECEDEEDEPTNNRISRKAVSSVISVPVAARIENKAAGTFVTGVDIFSKETKVKLEERAKRFGLPKDSEKSFVDEIEHLYDSFGFVEGSENAKNYRLNVVHTRGTENLSTKDIFKYFEKYAPASIEWLNDISCNVVWLDNASAARAILGLSKRIEGIRKEPKHKIHSDDDSIDESDDDMIVNGKHYTDENSIHVRDIRCPMPPGIWRKGKDYEGSRNILLRFATRSDRAEKIGDKHHNKHGSQNYGLKGILTTSRKRPYKLLKESSPPLKKDSSSTTNGIAAKNPWGSLSKNWGVADFVEDDYLPKAPPEPVSNVKQRLGYKPRRRLEEEEEDDDVEEVEDPNIIELSDESESESSSDEDNWCTRSKMPRMRMHADDEEEKIEKRKGKIRNIANNNIKPTNNDLRGKLTAKRRLPPIFKEEIQVVVTNPKAIIQSDFSNIDVTEDEEDNEDDEDDVEVVVKDNDEDVEEEGEILEESDNDSKVEYEEEEEEEEEEAESESQSDTESDSSESSESEKEIQGPKGSVIKVVQHKPKPKLASTVTTVWSRLHNNRNDRNSRSPERYSKRDLRHTLKKSDLRSRIGNNHMKGRSPLRIELRNDKYAGRQSDSE